MGYLIVVFVVALMIIGGFSRNVRILGGEDADVRTYPFLAVFKHLDNTYYFCSGAIISEKHILTTAQCFNEEPRHFVRVRAYTGIDPVESLPGTEHKIARVFPHPRFTTNANMDEMFLHDIAVVKLRKAIQLNEFQNVIELLNRDVTENDSGFVLGWGSTTYPSLSYPTKMQKAEIDVLPERLYSSFFKFIVHDTQFCVLDKEGVGACKGDGGSPFVIDGKLAGLASVIYHCGWGVPDVYTKIHYYIDFITDMKNY